MRYLRATRTKILIGTVAMLAIRACCFGGYRNGYRLVFINDSQKEMVEEIMRSLFIALLLTFSGYVFAQSTCEQYGGFTSLTKTWLSFRYASLKEKPEEISKFYKFPLKLLSPFDGDKPIVISKKFFLKEYESIFRDVDEEETDLFMALKKTRGNEYIPRNEFDANGCAYPVRGAVRIEDYNFVWKKTNGWIIESVFYGKEYFTLKDVVVRPVSEDAITR